MRVAVISIVVILLGALLWWLLPAGSPDALESVNTIEATEPAIEQEVDEEVDPQERILPMLSYDTYESEHGQLPSSLEGSAIPFNIEITADGQLVVDSNLRDLFDYFLTLDGEEPFEIIIARIEELLEKYLPQPALDRALDILNQYVNLKHAEAELAAQLDADLKASGRRPSLEELRRLRRDLRASNLDPETYEAFYGVEDKQDEYAVRRIAIQGDDSLTEKERQEALLALEQVLPEAERLQKEKERSTQNVYDDVERLKDEGASAAEIFAVRAEAFGAEAAQRYADADVKKEKWESRISTYREERKDILNTPGITESDKEYQIQQLREQHFEGNELKRIPVIDQMWDDRE